MNSSNSVERQGRRLVQLGVILLLFVSFEGFASPYLKSPMLGKSAHSLCSLLAVMFLAFGLLWPKLHLGPGALNLAYWLLIYSGLAIVAAYLLAGIWGAGNSTMPLAAGPAHGSIFQETVIRWVAYSSAPTGIISFVLIL